MACALCQPAVAADAESESALQRSIAVAVAEVESRVVQLQYFGAGSSEAIGASGAPVTGWRLGDSDWVLTSTYALDDNTAAIVCRTLDGVATPCRLVARDRNRKIALLRLGQGGVADTPPPLRGRRPRVGETAVAVGRVYDAGSVNVAIGVVSAIDRLSGRALQTDAAISPSNYGGPLIGLDGSLLGVITPLAPPGQSGVALYDSGVGFAVPTDVIEERLVSFAAGNDIHPGWLGVSVAKDEPFTTEPTVMEVLEGGPADQAGVLEGDRILSLGGRGTATVWEFGRHLRGLDAGAAIRLVADRNGEQLTLDATLGRKPKARSEDPTGPMREATKKPSRP